LRWGLFRGEIRFGCFGFDEVYTVGVYVHSIVFYALFIGKIRVVQTACDKYPFAFMEILLYKFCGLIPSGDIEKVRIVFVSLDGYAKTTTERTVLQWAAFGFSNQPSE
jgi:hypothetical protein